MKHLLVLSLATLASTANAGRLHLEVPLDPGGVFRADSMGLEGYAVASLDGYDLRGIQFTPDSIQSGTGLGDQVVRGWFAPYGAAEIVQATVKKGRFEGLVKVRGTERKVTGPVTIDGTRLKTTFQWDLADRETRTDVRTLGYVRVTAEWPILSRALP